MISTASPMTATPPAPPKFEPPTSALFADLDGTLAPVEATPDAVQPNGDRRRLVDALLKILEGRLAVISGRGLADLDRVLEGRVRAVAAVHGLIRRRADGSLITAARPARIDEAFARLRAFAARDSRLLVENKGAAVALHYRRAPTMEAACTTLAERLACRLELVIQPGDMVVELKAPGPDKGAAVGAFMTEPPFAGFTPVYVGDDLTDEAGFTAAQALGGFGVLVGARRPTGARFALADIGAARDWLAAPLGGRR